MSNINLFNYQQSLFERVCNVEELMTAYKAVKRNSGAPGVDGVSVEMFGAKLQEEIKQLKCELESWTYKASPVRSVEIPKAGGGVRKLGIPTVRDRVVHHLLYRSLAPFFFRVFIADSYSCQLGKGTHKALNRFAEFSSRVSKNNSQQCYVLKCDIKKFFASTDHRILQDILKSSIEDKKLLALLHIVICSFNSGVKGKGLPLGNLTSQLLVNIYMHEFDKYIKHTLKIKHYIRYADDFVVLSRDTSELIQILASMNIFLQNRLELTFHPKKVSIATVASGVDFLGWVHFPKHRIIRPVSRKRMYRKLFESKCENTLVQSYFGLLKHGNTHKLLTEIRDSLRRN